MSRIFTKPEEDKPSISKKAVLDFFEQRAAKVPQLGAVQAVIYQDKTPDLATRRDAAEKALLFPKIQLRTEDRVLDAGCGTGRWASLLIPACSHYHGVDVSPGLIRVAQETYGTEQNARFSVASLDEISLEKLEETTPFTRIVSFGVYIYLNDDDVLRALMGIASCAALSARVVVREPIAVENRLTLREHFSQDMDQYYNAIYRTEFELKSLFDATLGGTGFRLVESGDVYAQADLNNRAETKQRWYIWERG